MKSFSIKTTSCNIRSTRFISKEIFSKTQNYDSINEKTNATRAVIPATFQDSWTLINRVFYVGIDWMDTFSHVLLSIVLWRLQDGAAKKALMDLTNGWALALQ